MPSETLLMKERPLIRPTSTRRSLWLDAKASRAARGRARSNPRSRAKWLSVPVGTTTRGKSRSTTTPATAATVPSPPATASDPEPSSAASRAACPASSPGSSTRTPIERSRAAPVRLSARAAALPAAGLIIRQQEVTLASATSGVLLVRSFGLWCRPAPHWRAPQLLERWRFRVRREHARIPQLSDQRPQVCLRAADQVRSPCKEPHRRPTNRQETDKLDRATRSLAYRQLSCLHLLGGEDALDAADQLHRDAQQRPEYHLVESGSANRVGKHHLARLVYQPARQRGSRLSGSLGKGCQVRPRPYGLGSRHVIYIVHCGAPVVLNRLWASP